MNEHEVSSDTLGEKRGSKAPRLLVATSAWLMDRPWVVLGSGVAALLCLFPGVLVLFLAHRLAIDEAHKTLVLSVGGSFLRLVFVLGAGLALYNSFSELTIWSLVIWIVLFYVVTLIVETWLLLAVPTR